MSHTSETKALVVEFLKYKTYLARIYGSVGSDIFRTVYARVDGVEKDITENGRWGCAVHVSSILVLSGLLPTVHAGVKGLVRNIELSGWKTVDVPSRGAIILWEACEASHGYSHVGFYMGGKQAISMNSVIDPPYPHRKRGCPIKHHYTFGTHKDGTSKRKIVAFYWSPLLDAWSFNEINRDERN